MTRIIARSVLAACTLPSLVACTILSDPYDSRVSDTLDLLDRTSLSSFADLGDATTPEASVQTSGTASYSGNAGVIITDPGDPIPILETAADVDGLAAYSLTATFGGGGGTFTSSITDMIGRDDVEYGGQLTVNGTIDRNPASVGDPDGSVNFDGTLAGAFTGTGELAGSYSGDLNSIVINSGSAIASLGGGTFTPASGGPDKNYSILGVAD